MLFQRTTKSTYTFIFISSILILGLVGSAFIQQQKAVDPKASYAAQACIDKPALNLITTQIQATFDDDSMKMFVKYYTYFNILIYETNIQIGPGACDLDFQYFPSQLNRPDR